MKKTTSKKYVLTGGPGVGKSTVLSILAKKGYSVIPECARAIIEEEMKKDSDVLPWKNLLKFQEEILQRQFAIEKKTTGEEIFLDRGIIDGYAFCKHGKVKAPQALIDNAKGRYDKIFLLAPLEKYENDHIRREKDEFMRAIHALIEEAYKEFGYDIIHVPFLSPSKRVDFILKAVKSSP